MESHNKKLSSKPLVWHTEQRRVKDLLPFKHNPRTMSEKTKQDLINSIQQFGLVY